MNKMENTEFLRSNLELDYLKLCGKMTEFDAENGKDRAAVREALEERGIIEIKSGGDWIYFANEELGIRVFFSNYPMDNKRVKRSPSLSIDFTGHYFIYQNSDLAARNLIKFFVDKFKTFFKINRVDIRQDIYGVKKPFDYIPNWIEEKTKFQWNLRGNAKQNLYSHSLDGNTTGLTVSTSRYKIMSYNRNISLETKYRKGEISKEYYNYYKQLYKGRDVQRFEVTLRQDACNFFAIQFLGENYDKDKVLKLTMANFGRTHCLKNVERGKPINKWQNNEIFAELYYLEEKPEVKKFKEFFEAKSGLKIYQVDWTGQGRDINEIVKMLARKIAQVADGVETKRNDIVNNIVSSIKLISEELCDEIDNKKDAMMRTFASMDMDFVANIEARSLITKNICNTI